LRFVTSSPSEEAFERANDIRQGWFERGVAWQCFVPMSTAEKIFQKAQSLPEPAQDKLLHVAEELARQYPAAASSPLTLNETTELRGKFAAWEDDWNAPGMAAYDRA